MRPKQPRTLLEQCYHSQVPYEGPVILYIHVQQGAESSAVAYAPTCSGSGSPADKPLALDPSGTLLLVKEGILQKSYKNFLFHC